MSFKNPKALTFRDGGRYHIETSPLVCRANQWTGFYMITASVLQGLRKCSENLQPQIPGLQFLKTLNYPRAL